MHTGFVKDRAGYLLQPRLVWQEILEHNVSCAAPKYDFAIRGLLVWTEVSIPRRFTTRVSAAYSARSTQCSYQTDICPLIMFSYSPSTSACARLDADAGWVEWLWLHEIGLPMARGSADTQPLFLNHVIYRRRILVYFGFFRRL